MYLELSLKIMQMQVPTFVVYFSGYSIHGGCNPLRFYSRRKTRPSPYITDAVRNAAEYAFVTHQKTLMLIAINHYDSFLFQ